jgi:hypothetical protein
MFEEMVVDTLCIPVVENVTANTPLPTMRPKLTRKVFGVKVALGSVEFNVTVYDPWSNPHDTRMFPGTETPRATALGGAVVGAVVGAGATGQEATPGST